MSPGLCHIKCECPVDAFLHTSHLKGFSLVCVLRCLFICHYVNYKLQSYWCETKFCHMQATFHAKMSFMPTVSLSFHGGTQAWNAENVLWQTQDTRRVKTIFCVCPQADVYSQVWRTLHLFQKTWQKVCKLRFKCCEHPRKSGALTMNCLHFFVYKICHSGYRWQLPAVPVCVSVFVYVCACLCGCVAGRGVCVRYGGLWNTLKMGIWNWLQFFFPGNCVRCV